MNSKDKFNNHNMNMIYFVTFCFVVGTLSVADAATEAEVRALVDAKLNSTDYSSRVRPIRDTGNILQLTVDMWLVALNDVNEVEQKITTTAYLQIEWTDTFLVWVPGDYQSIQKITIPQERIWKPDLALANAYDTITGLGDKFIQLDIAYNGVITWKPYQVFDSTCSLDMTYFPFDTQTCDIQLVTWSSTKEMINLNAGTVGFNSDDYEKNANWDLLSTTTFDSSSSTTAGLSFRIQLKRKPAYFLINFIIPIVLLSVLNVFVFVLPCDSGEKTSYAIILFLSFAVFLLIVTEIMPEGMNTIPIMSTYLLVECILSTIIVFISIIQLRFHNQGDDTPVPNFLKSFVGVIEAVRNKCCCSGGDDDTADDSYDDETDVKAPIDGDATEVKRSAHLNGGVRGQKTSAYTNGRKNSSSSEGSIVSKFLSRSNSKVKDLLYGNGKRVSPLFNKPQTTFTPYSTQIELQDLDYEMWGLDKGAPPDVVHAKGANGYRLEKQMHPNNVAHSAFIVKRNQNLIEVDSASNKDGSEEEASTSWSDVSSAMDFLFFILFCIINGLTTIVVFIVTVAGS